MTIDLDKPSAIINLKILSNINGKLIIAIHGHETLLFKVKFSQEVV